MNHKEAIATSNAPEAIGPYSQGIMFGNLVFTSGQLPLGPETMLFPEGGIKEQTRQSIENVNAVLEKSGASLDTVLKTTCFLADLSDFAEFNEVYGSYFSGSDAPARSCVEAAKLPKDAKVEIEVIAYKKQRL
jgi:reactive intermediate/imine deaminase